jgi:hypothetical protein
MDFRQVAQDRVKQYTVYSNKTSYTNSKQYTVLQTREFVESLDRRLYKVPQYLPFYCKAARTLGFGRVLELQGMVLADPRLTGPEDKFNPEKVFWSLLREELSPRRAGNA